MVTRTGRVWLDTDGIVHCSNRSTARQTREHAEENIAAVLVISGGVRRPMLLDTTIAAPQAHECMQSYASVDPSSGPLAVAIVSSSAMGRVIGNLLIGMQNPTVPARLFSTPAQAKAWLLGFLNRKSAPPNASRRSSKRGN